MDLESVRLLRKRFSSKIVSLRRYGQIFFENLAGIMTSPFSYGKRAQSPSSASFAGASKKRPPPTGLRNFPAFHEKFAWSARGTPQFSETFAPAGPRNRAASEASDEARLAGPGAKVYGKLAGPRGPAIFSWSAGKLAGLGGGCPGPRAKARGPTISHFRKTLDRSGVPYVTLKELESSIGGAVAVLLQKQKTQPKANPMTFCYLNFASEI